MQFYTIGSEENKDTDGWPVPLLFAKGFTQVFARRSSLKMRYPFEKNDLKLRRPVSKDDLKCDIEKVPKIRQK